MATASVDPEQNGHKQGSEYVENNVVVSDEKMKYQQTVGDPLFALVKRWH